MEWPAGMVVTYLTMMLWQGVDVSDWQPGIDWMAVVGSGVRFAIVKATQGTGNVQDTFSTNRNEAPAAGIRTLGLYHFAEPENGVPEAEADHFCDVVGSLRPNEFVALDIETGDQSVWADFIMRWFERVDSRLGDVPAVLYSSDDPASRLPTRCAQFPLWDAAFGQDTGSPASWGKGYEPEYADQPFEHSWPTGPWRTWTIWQYTSRGSVPGIPGNVDLNLAPEDLMERLGIDGQKPGTPGRTATVGWQELDSFLLQEGVQINQPAEDWQTTGGTHASTSWHYPKADEPDKGIGHARDYSTGMTCDEAGVVSALRPFAVPGGQIIELFHAATGTWLKNGEPIAPLLDADGNLTHTDHCHSAIRPGVSLPVFVDYPSEEETELYVFSAPGHDTGTWITDGIFRRPTNAPGPYLDAGVKYAKGSGPDGAFTDGEFFELIDAHEAGNALVALIGALKNLPTGGPGTVDPAAVAAATVAEFARRLKD